MVKRGRARGLGFGCKWSTPRGLTGGGVRLVPWGGTWENPAPSLTCLRMHLVTDTAPPCTLGNPSSLSSPPRLNMHLAQKACTLLKAQVHLPRQLQPFLSLSTTQFYRLVWKRLLVPSVVCLAESQGLQNAQHQSSSPLLCHFPSRGAMLYCLLRACAQTPGPGSLPRAHSHCKHTPGKAAVCHAEPNHPAQTVPERGLIQVSGIRADKNLQDGLSQHPSIDKGTEPGRGSD